MALSALYFVTSDLNTYFVNKDSGLPLANGTISFYRDASRNEPKEVFQLSGTYPNYTYTSMGTVITLSAVGTVQNSGADNEVIYYYPWITNEEGTLVLDLYYAVIQDSGGTVQETREAWPNLTAAGSTPSEQSENSVTNQISNPQFSNVFINEGITTTYTVPATTTNMVFAFAPDWDWVISNPTGTPLSVILQRLPITGSQHVPTSPPYVIEISVPAGISSCHLRQRFPKNSGLWATTSSTAKVFLYGSYVAQNQLAGSTSIAMFYQESNGVNNITPVPIIDTTHQFTNPYEVVTGSSAFIPGSSSSDSGEAGYVDIYLEFPVPCSVRFSSIQLIPSEIAPTDIVLPDFDSSNRNESFQGDYYIPRAATKQIDSFLVGWDFPVNPFQFGNSGTITSIPVAPVNTSPYICDQTIGFLGGTSTVAWTRNAITQGLQFIPAGATNAFYIQQYLSGDQVKDMIGNRMSVNVFAYENATVGSDPIIMRVYLLRAPSTSTIPILPLFLGTQAGGTFTVTAPGWTEIPRSGLPTAQANLNKIFSVSDLNNNNDIGFTGWQITDPAHLTDTSLFSIIVTFEFIIASPVVVVNSISVVPGDLPCRPAVKTLSQTLMDCQYYYEKSYNLDVLPAAATPVGSISEIQPGAASVGTFRGLIFVGYLSRKRTPVTPIFYAPDGTINNVSFQSYSNGGVYNTQNLPITQWTVQESSAINYALDPNTFNFVSPNVNAVFAIVTFQYYADARLAVV